MGRVLLFSFTAMLNPTLVAATTVMLLMDRPRRLMLGYLLGALMTSITIGLLIVFALQDAGVTNTAKNTVNPFVDLGLGAILLAVSAAIRTGRDQRLRERRRRRKEAKPDKGPPRWQRALNRGSPRTTFAVGAVLTLPGASYLAALDSIDKLNKGTVSTVLLVLMVNAIMLTLIELPLICFTVAPDWTPATVERVKAWFARNAENVVVFGTGGLGALLIVRGLITLLS